MCRDSASFVLGVCFELTVVWKVKILILQYMSAGWVLVLVIERRYYYRKNVFLPCLYYLWCAAAVCCIKIHTYHFWITKTTLMFLSIFRPDITAMVDWALKLINYLSIFCQYHFRITSTRPVFLLVNIDFRITSTTLVFLSIENNQDRIGVSFD